MDVTQVLESTLSPGMFFLFHFFYIILLFLSFSLFLAIFLIHFCAAPSLIGCFPPRSPDATTRSNAEQQLLHASQADFVCSSAFYYHKSCRYGLEQGC